MKKLTDAQRASIAEDFAVSEFDMEKAGTNQPGYDGTLPDGKRLQVKSKIWGAHSDSSTVVYLEETVVKGLDAADLLLVVFVDDETEEVKRYIGLTPIGEVIEVAKPVLSYRITVNKLSPISPDVTL